MKIWDRFKSLVNAVPRGMGTLTKAAAGSVNSLTASFTPVISAKQPTPARVQNMAIAEAGKLIDPQREKKITPEQTFDQSLHPSPDPTAATQTDEPLPPEKTDSIVTAARVQQYLLAKFNPIRGLTPKLLSHYLEQWDLGFLRQFSLIWAKIKERDDQVVTVSVKRELRPTDMPWQIVPVDDDKSDEAQQHKEALQEFYDKCVVTDCVQQNTRGGVSLLIRQMMRAVGDRFSTHEIIWKPEPDSLTAEFKWIPPWFFENRTGQLRYLPYELALQGVPLDPAGWVVHVAEGLGQACAIAYLFKQMALKDWVNYTEKFGLPFLHGKTNAPFGSQEWEQFLTALEKFSSDGAILTSLQAELAPITVGHAGDMPHPALCDRMDRAMARIWAGGDLSTMSRGGSGGEHGSGGKSGSAGALPQLQNEDDLAKADAERISETLNFYVDRNVIKYRFGEGVAPKAKFTLVPPRDIDSTRQIAEDTFLLSVGFPITKQDMADRYERDLPPDDTNPSDLLTAPKSAVTAAQFGNVALGPAFQKYQVSSSELVARAQAKALEPVRERLQEIAKIDDTETRTAALKKLREDLPRFFKKAAGSADLQNAFQNVIGTAIAIGASESAKAGAKKTNGHHILERISHGR